MRKPTETAFDQPAPWQHHKAFLSGIAADHMVAHAMEVGPFAATIGGEATIEDGQPQARPVRATDIKRRERVALLHRSRNGVDRQPDAISINQRHTLAPNRYLGRVIATRAAHGDALDRLRVDDPQCWRRTRSRRTPPPHRNLAHQAVEQTKFQPTRYLLLGKLRYHILQAVDPLCGSTMPRPMLLRPHPVSPPCQADLFFNH